MSEWNIINSAGTVVATAKKVEYHGKLMDERYVTVDIDSPVRLDLTAGDYMIYRGDKFTLRDSSEVEKSARPQSYGGAFTYKGLKLVAQSWQELHDTEMTDYVYGDNKMHYTGLGTFSFYMTKVSDMGYRVQAVMDNKYGVGKWVVKIGGIAISGNYSDVEVDDAKSISISSGTSVKDTLDMLWSEWGYYYKVTSGIVNNEIVHYVDLCPSVGTTLPLYYGKKRTEVIAGEEKEVGGLVKIVRKINPNVEICTRVRAYGSERNLPYHWYNNKYGDQTNPYDPLRSMYIPQLMLPHTVAYYDEDGNYCDEDGRLYEANDPAVWDSERQARRSVNLWEYPNDVVLENVITSDKFGKRDKEVHWNSDEMGEIFPSMKGMTSDDVPSLDGIYDSNIPLDQVLGFHYASESDTGSSSPEDVTSDKLNFVVRVPNPGFNPTDHNTSDNVELLMQSGMCQARAFTIIKSEAVESDDKIVAYDLTCAKIIDEEIDQVFPNSPDFEIEAGDEYVYTGLEFNGDYSQDTWLDVYISAAEMRLLRAAALWLREHSREEYIHEVSIDNVFMKTVPNISANLLEGASVKVTDNNIGSDKTDIVESVTITEGKDAIPTYEITFLRRDESESLGDRVKGLVGQSISASSEIAKANDGLAKKVNKTGFHTLFDPLDAQYNVLDINGDLSNLKYIRANVDFYSVKGVSALGTGGPSGGGGGGDLNALLDSINSSSIGDIAPTASETGKCLVYNGNGNWAWTTPGGGGGGSSINTVSVSSPGLLTGGSVSGTTLTLNTRSIQASDVPFCVSFQNQTSYVAARLYNSDNLPSLAHSTYIEWWSSAGWYNHAMGHLILMDGSNQIWADTSGSKKFTLPSASGTLATQEWVSANDANNYLTGVSGSANGTMTFTRQGLSSITFDSTHTHSNYVSSIYYNNSATLTSPYYVVTSGSVSGNTLTLGRSKLSSLLNAAGYTWWGQTMNANGVVEGNMTGVGSIAMSGTLRLGSASGASPYIYWGDGNYTYIGEDADDHITIRGDKGVNILTGSNYELQWNGAAVATQSWVDGHGYMLREEGMRFVDYGDYIAARFVNANGTYDATRAAKAQGEGYIEWWSDGGYFNHEMGFIRAKGNITIGTGTSDTTHYIQIGGGRLFWDNTNNALYVQKADGTAAHFYATGGVSALGMSVGGTPSMNTLTLQTLTVNGSATIASLTVRNTISSLTVDDLDVSNNLYMNGCDISMEGGYINNCGTLGADAIETGTLLVGSGSELKKIQWDGTYLQVQIGTTTYKFRPDVTS